MSMRIILIVVMILTSINSFGEVCEDETTNSLQLELMNLIKITLPNCKSYPTLASSPKISLNLSPSNATIGAIFDLTFTSKVKVKDVASLKKIVSAEFINDAAGMVETFDSDLKQKLVTTNSNKTGYATVSHNTRSPFPTKHFYSKCEIKKETETEFETICKFDDNQGDTKDYVANYVTTKKCKKSSDGFWCTTFVLMSPKSIKRVGVEFASSNEVASKGALRALRGLVAQSILINAKDKNEALEQYRCNDFESKINDYLDKVSEKFVAPPKFTYN